MDRNWVDGYIGSAAPSLPSAWRLPIPPPHQIILLYLRIQSRPYVNVFRNEINPAKFTDWIIVNMCDFSEHTQFLVWEASRWG